MGLLSLYALTDQPLRLPGQGRGAPFCLLPICEGLFVVAKEARALPRLTARALKAHDVAVRRMAEEAKALLPFRFRARAEHKEHLERLLAPRALELREALRRVSGCEQMTLRVYRGAPCPPEPEEPTTTGPGTRYLRERARALSPPALSPLRQALAPLLREERLAHHHSPPLLISAYHLVPKRNKSAYLIALRAAVAQTPLRIVPSGPWPPYAFAPEALL